VDRVIQGILAVFTSPNLPWWGDMLMAGACCGVIFLLVSFGSKNAVKSQSGDHLQLQIHSAIWGTDASHSQVGGTIDGKPRNALAFFVNQDAFPLPDPAHGVDEKYVEVKYSYTGSGPKTIRRKQGEWIVLPEDPVLLKRIEDNFAQYLEDNEELSKGKIAKRDAVTALTRTAKLLIEYKPSQIGKTEHLIFVNDGSVTIQDIVVGPLLWGCGLLRREISLHNVVGPLMAGKQVECKTVFLERQGTNQIILELPDMLKQINRQLGVDAKAIVHVQYKDSNQNEFSINFSLSIDLYDRVVWNPEQVQLESAAKGML
jgi:hypothetical protein